MRRLRLCVFRTGAAAVAPRLFAGAAWACPRRMASSALNTFRRIGAVACRGRRLSDCGGRARLKLRPRGRRDMDVQENLPRQPAPSSWRLHDGNGISDRAHAVIVDHDLSMGTILDIADRYAPRDGVDFNVAPTRDITRARLWKDLNVAASGQTAPAADAARFARALSLNEHGTSDAIVSSWLRDGRLADGDGRNLYAYWRRGAEYMEGVNAALHKAAENAVHLHRLVGNVDEFDNYQRGRWRRAGDGLDRVSLTVGVTNPILSGREALVAYDARLLAGCIQPVRYSPYPRLDEGGREGFGSEKYAAYAGEGEVHLYAGCRTLPRDHVNILLLGDAKRRRAEIVARYGEAGVFH